MSEQPASVVWWSTVFALLPVLLCFGLVRAFYWWHSTLPLSKCCRVIPNMKVLPVYTHLLYLKFMYRRKYPRAYFLQLMAGYCKIFERNRIALLWLGFRPIIFFFKPETTEILLNNSVSITKSAEYDFLKGWLGTGLLTSTGEKWRYLRKLLTPSFHFQILDNFVPVFNEQAEILSNKLESAVGKAWIDIVPLITMCTLDTISQTAMGVRLDTQLGRSEEYFTATEEISDVFVYRLVRPWLWFDLPFWYLFPSGWKFRQNVRLIHDFTRKVIKEKKECMLKERAEQGWGAKERQRKKAFLELLLEHYLTDENFTEEHIREEVDTFMFEGHDTTAVSLCWTLYELGRNPQIQEKVFQELDCIFGYDTERHVTPEDLKQMKYLECTIKESLRLNPSVAFIGRQLQEDLVINDITLKPGCTCFVLIFMLHMDPDQFPEPDIFNPDRFLPDSNNKRHPFAYVPFSAGPRNCIGQRFALMEQKTILAHILRKFRVTSPDPRDRMERMAGLTLKNAEPIKISFELRMAAES